MNLIINYYWGDDIFEKDDLKIYLRSLDKIKNTRKILLFSKSSHEKINQISQHYDGAIEFFADINYLDEVIYEFISTCSHLYEYILINDSRDVIFQKDPFEYMSLNQKNIYMTSEGMKLKHSAPNYNWVFNLMKTQRDFSEHVFENEVVNGGVFGGKIEYVMLLLMISFTNRNRNSSSPIYNQPVYSFIENYLKMANFVEICKPHTSLFCITGEGVGKHGVPMKIIDGLACNENDEPYFIVHQWDRTFFAEEVRNRYLEGKNK